MPMDASEIIGQYQQHPKINVLNNHVAKPNACVHIGGLVGSSLSFVIQALAKKNEQHFVLLFSDREKAAYVFNDLETLLPPQLVLFYPSSYKNPYQIEKTDNANILLRSEVLNQIGQAKKPHIIVSYPEALFEKVVTRTERNKNTLKLSVNESVSIDFVNEVLFEYEFKRVDFVSEPGEFSVRGGIIDVFSFANDHPYRIEFFGNEIESIRTFDLETQLSIEKQKSIRILPNLETKTALENRENFLDHIPKNTVLVLEDWNDALTQINALYAKADAVFSTLKTTVKQLPPELLFINSEALHHSILNHKIISLHPKPPIACTDSVIFYTKPQPSFNKQFDLLLANLNENHFNGITNYITSANEQQTKRFHDIFESIDEENHQTNSQQYKTLVLSLSEGFIDEELQLACYTDHQIFERYHKFHLKNSYTAKKSVTLKELNTLSIGDYVTHIDHGIGRFGGLQKIEVEGKMQEAIKLVYADNDIVYVSIHSLHKIAKYNGKDGSVPKIHKLGSNAWKVLKQKTKARVKNIAFNLIQLYAKRRTAKGFACAPDSYLQLELESSFIYEDTPDQTKATQEVKTDMESDRPMDRLVCGDVGFGKTEVAIRACFKAVDNGKQVAVLVPTTILAYQHHRTFTERLKELPVNVGYLNRFRTAKEKAQTLQDLASGKLDIIIGTHQLVSKNVVFKDLGLLVIDEEQKFGVNVKDKLKTISENVDTLTLTATPIPRTLQFSLMAARDLSVITTPPPNRYPIESAVIGFSETVIRDAITYELQRGGQVFFIHNRIENITEVAGMIQRLIPHARIGIGHGQMEGKKLEERMLAFINGEFDVLVATTIVESGLDVPNANTIFINNANTFGLSDLHQMRGRVGRGNKKAFCYFITPPLSTLTDDARKRIKALEQFSDLGSGFNIAMKDLEIRGAGDLLGGEQSGFINEIGFDTYQKIMNEAIDELKENEFKSLYNTPENIENKTYVKEIQIDTDFELLFPDSYINNIPERLTLYNELAACQTEEQLNLFVSKITDRFGPPPKPAIDLINSVKIKWKAVAIGLEKLVLKQKKMLGYFIADQQSEFYSTSRFTRVIQFAQEHPQIVRLKEKQTKNGLRLLLTFENITSINKALEIVEKI
jgi:transcription-repair coupling factor (superfamily II helicase)